MKKYQTLLLETFNSYFKFTHYQIFSLPLRIFLIVLFTPVHLLFLTLAIFYQILYFLIVMIRVPADFIKETIDENSTYSPAAHVVVFLIAYPTKFLFDLSTAFSLVGLAWVFFLMQLFTYIGSLGNIRFQPYLLSTTQPIAKQKPDFQCTKKQEIIVFIVLLSLVVVIGAIILTRNIIKNNEMYDDASSVIINVLEEENMTNGYIIEGAKYDKDGDYFVFKIRYAGEVHYYMTHWQYSYWTEIDSSDFNSQTKALDLNETRLARIVGKLLE